jgi:hypothetical protein
MVLDCGLKPPLSPCPHGGTAGWLGTGTLDKFNIPSVFKDLCGGAWHQTCNILLSELASRRSWLLRCSKEARCSASRYRIARRV